MECTVARATGPSAKNPCRLPVLRSGIHKQTHLPAEFDKARAHLADGTAIVLPEIGDRLVVGDKPAKQPHQLDIAAGLALEPPARGLAWMVDIVHEIAREQDLDFKLYTLTA
jgi:hypothetical protein